MSTASQSGTSKRDVDLEPLADLLLGLGDPVVGVDREAAQLDLRPTTRSLRGGLPCGANANGDGLDRRAATARPGSHSRRRAPGAPRRRREPGRPRPRRASASTLEAIVAAEAVVDLAAGERAEEALARGADHDRAAELAQLAEAAAGARGCGRRSCRTRSQGRPRSAPRRSPPRRRTRSARRGRRGRRRRRRRSAGRPASCAGRPACASSTSLQPRSAHSAGELGVGPQGGDVVDDRGPGVERRLGDRRLRGVDRDRRRRGRRPAPRPRARRGRARPPRRPPGARAGSTRRRCRAGRRPGAASSRPWAIARSGSRNSAAVGERVRGHVDDPHQARAIAHARSIARTRKRRGAGRGPPLEATTFGRAATGSRSGVARSRT